MISHEGNSIQKKEFFILQPDYQKTDFIHFKEEVLKELKEQNKNIIDQYKKEKEPINEKLDEFTNKISNFQIKINELSDLVVKNRINKESLKNLINFSKKADDIMTTNTIKLQLIEKDNFDNITEIKKTLRDTVIYPGLIGKKCKFECFHQLIDYILLQISTNSDFKERLEYNFNVYNQKIDKNIKEINMKIDSMEHSMKHFVLTNIKETENRLNDKILIYIGELIELRENYKKYIEQAKIEKESYIEKFNKLLSEVDNMKKDINDQKNFITDNKNNIKTINDKISNLSNVYKNLSDKVDKFNNRILYNLRNRRENNMNTYMNFYTSEFGNLKNDDFQLSEFSKDVSPINKNLEEKNNQNFSYDNNLNNKDDNKSKLALNNSNSEKNIRNNNNLIFNNLPASASNKRNQRKSYIRLYINGEINPDEIGFLANKHKIEKQSITNIIKEKFINNFPPNIKIQRQQQNPTISRKTLKLFESNSQKSKHTSCNNNIDNEDIKFYKKDMLNNNNINIQNIKKILGINLQDINAQYNRDNITSPRNNNFGNYFIDYGNMQNANQKKNNAGNNPYLKLFSNKTTFYDYNNLNLNSNNYYSSLSEDYENRENSSKEKIKDFVTAITNKNSNNIINNKNKLLQINKNIIQNLLKSDKKYKTLRISKSTKKLSLSNLDSHIHLINSIQNNKNNEASNLNKNEITNNINNISGTEPIKEEEKDNNTIKSVESTEKDNKNNKKQ